MKPRTLLAAVLATALLSVSAQTETNRVERLALRQRLREAREAFGEDAGEALAEAADHFKAVREQGEEGEFDLDALRLAEGMAHLRAGKPEQALQVLDAVEGFENAPERARHRRLKGLAHMGLAEAAANEERWDDALRDMDEAVSDFTRSLKETPDDEASRHNLELAHRRRREIEQQKPPPPPESEDQENEDEQDQDEQDQDEQEQDEQERDEQEQDSEEQDGESQDEEETQPEEQEGDESSADEEGEQDPQDAEGEGEPRSADEPEGEADPSAAGEPGEEEVDAREAARILEAYLEQEKRQRRQLLEEQMRRLRRQPVEKDW